MFQLKKTLRTLSRQVKKSPFAFVVIASLSLLPFISSNACATNPLEIQYERLLPKQTNPWVHYFQQKIYAEENAADGPSPQEPNLIGKEDAEAGFTKMVRGIALADEEKRQDFIELNGLGAFLDIQQKTAADAQEGRTVLQAYFKNLHAVLGYIEEELSEIERETKSRYDTVMQLWQKCEEHKKTLEEKREEALLKSLPPIEIKLNSLLTKASQLKAPKFSFTKEEAEAGFTKMLKALALINEENRENFINSNSLDMFLEAQNLTYIEALEGRAVLQQYFKYLHQKILYLATVARPRKKDRTRNLLFAQAHLGETLKKYLAAIQQAEQKAQEVGQAPPPQSSWPSIKEVFWAHLPEMITGATLLVLGGMYYSHPHFFTNR